MQKKYELLTADAINVQHPITKKVVKLHRIIALKTFELKIPRTETIITIRQNHIGGYVQSESCLSQLDNSWIDHEAKVFEDSVVRNDSYVYRNAHIYGECDIANSAVHGWVHIGGRCNIANSSIQDSATILSKCTVSNSIIRGNCLVRQGCVVENSIIEGGSIVEQTSIVQRSMISDVCGIIDSKVRNSSLSGRTVIKKQTIENSSIDTPLGLAIDVPNVDLGQHGIL